ncbi:hypothetical protein [Selenihalanaerobacter shriftii]|uniref:Doubled CXXCH domain-containing protein n=1 Tax=Selenihalanaerobacter shriftii TaxID=142842 RepID=A0A1T4L4X3_9FIRM|nr:hypothetical protein [Selenihalanaerobacter shriftii]SJZ49678.1 hypothetical protein SAMN02745118_01038 [Selenihalanaerobacter shriftii]
MKKLGIIFLSILVIALFAIPTLAAGDDTNGIVVRDDGTFGIDGSGHDFATMQGEAGNGYDILTGADISCVGCHVPHNTNPEEEGALFSDYYDSSTDGSTTDGGLTPPSKLYDFSGFTTNTKLCMSCHDGTMTVPQTAGTTTEDTSGAGGSQVDMMENVISRDLNDDHPVGVAYNTHRFRGLTTMSYSDTTFKADLNPGDETYALLTHNDTSDQVVSCYTCHDPHLDIDGMQSDEDSFLRVKTQQAWDDTAVDITTFQEGGHAAENLCIQCHQK